MQIALDPLLEKERELDRMLADLQATKKTVVSLRTSIAQGKNLRRRARIELERELLAQQSREIGLRDQIRALDKQVNALYLKHPLVTRQ